MFRILHRFFQRIGSDRRDEISCAKIERPSPLEKPSCKVQLFAQNRSRNYRQKVTVTTLFPTVPHRVFNFSHKWPTFAFTDESVHSRLSEKDRTQRLTRRNRSLPSPGHSIVTERTAGGSGCTPMACVRFLRRRGPAGLRDLFLLLSKLWLYALCLGLFARAKEGGGIITLGVFRALLKRWTSACQKGSFAVF